MEVRGLGLINIKDLFGVASTRSSKRVELVVQLERWEPGREYERLGPRRRALRDPRPARAAAADAGGARAATCRSWSKSRRATSCCARAATTPPASSRPGWSGSCASPDAGRTMPTPTGTTAPRGNRDAGVETRGRPRQARPAATGSRFIVLTGLSGAGKSQAIRALEDLGYFCVDNLPITPDPHAGRAVAAGGERSQARGDRRGRARRRVPLDVPEGAAEAAGDARTEPRADLPRSRRRGAGAALQRDAAAAPAGARPAGDRRHPRGARAPRADPRARRRDRRHDRPDRARTARGVHVDLARPVAPRPDAHHLHELRLQARRAGRGRPACSTSAACRTRTSCRNCASGPGRDRLVVAVHGGARGVGRLPREDHRLPPLRRAALRRRRARAT